MPLNDLFKEGQKATKMPPGGNLLVTMQSSCEGAFVASMPYIVQLLNTIKSAN
jgi:hypothetical protein